MICDMIIKAIRYRTRSSVSRLISHLQNGTDNDAVSFLSGTPADIADMHADARGRPSKYSIRHWIVAPHEATTRAQMREVVAMIALEFGFNAERAVIVEHKKARAAEDADGTHWHVLVGEVDPVSGKVLKCSFDRIIHELIARWSEFKFGHTFVSGKHTKSVISGLRKRGAVDAASNIEDQLDPSACSPAEAFTHRQHQAKKRAGIDLAVVRQAVRRGLETAINRAELEAVLAKSSLLLMPGEKPRTWIVTDMDRQFLGSLPRLAGDKKSEIAKIMKGADFEPVNDKSDNRTSNFSRSTSHTQPVAVVKRPANTRAGGACSDTAQNLGRTRKRIEPDRTGKPETGSSQTINRSAISLFVGLDKYRDQLELLMAKANMLAMVPEERIAASLWELEQQARADLSRETPPFEASGQTVRLRGEAAHLEKSAAIRWDVLFAAELRLAKAKRPRWWHYLLGISFLFERQQRQLTSAVQQAFDALESCNRDVESLKMRLVRLESQDKQKHENVVRDIAMRKQAAGPRLEQLNAANEILRVHPTMAFRGLDFILARARDRIDAEKPKEASIAKNLENDGVGYKR